MPNDPTGGELADAVFEPKPHLRMEGLQSLQGEPGDRFITVRVWRGEEPLWVTFYFFWLCVPRVWAAYDPAALTFGSFHWSLYWLSLGVYQLFATVSLWRAANRHRGRRIWAWLAKIMVIASVWQLVITIPRMFPRF